MAFQDHVIKELNRLPAKYKLETKSDSVWLCCPFHKGDGTDGLEKTPSMQIRIVHGAFPIGSARCHACAKAFKDWNSFARAFKLKEAVDYDENPYDVLTEADRQHMLGVEDYSGLDLQTMLPWDSNMPWRGINGKLVNRIGGHLYYSEAVQDTQLYLPCMVNNIHVGGISCVINPPKDIKVLKYINTKGQWASHYLYGYDYSIKMLRRYRLHTALIVEGPRDALNMIQNGIPTFALLGTAQWNEHKKNLIMGLDLKRLIIATDPDTAGDKASRAINHDLSPYMDVRRFKLDAETAEDPGNMRPERIAKLKTYVK